MSEEGSERKKQPRIEAKQDHPIIDSQKLFQPGQSGFFGLSKSKRSNIKQKVLEYLGKGDRNELQEYLARYKPEEIRRFFLKNGMVIFTFALTNMPRCEPLKILIETIPKEALKEVLRQDDFSVLQSFLGAQVGLEKADLSDEENQVEKFKILLSIDFNVVKEFMYKKENASNSFLQTEKIRANFNLALKRYGEEASRSSNLVALQGA